MALCIKGIILYQPDKINPKIVLFFKVSELLKPITVCFLDIFQTFLSSKYQERKAWESCKKPFFSLHENITKKKVNGSD